MAGRPLKIFIYTLNCPITGLVRYVGKTNNIKERFRKHISERNKTKKCKWIIGLKNKNLKPQFEVIDECGSDNWQDVERGYIKLFKSFGAELLNQMPGGEGGATMLGRNLTNEQRQKISASKIGMKREDLIMINKVSKGYRINQYDLSGKLISTHMTINDAAKAIGRSSRRIQMMVTGTGKKVNQVGGYCFSMGYKLENIE